jgi:O-antigen/teichoic acid export membrane protein
MTGIYFFSAQAVSYFSKTGIIELSGLLKLAVAIPLLLSISIPLKQLLLGFSKQRVYIKLTMIMVLVNLILMMLILPVYKIQGVIISLIFTELATIVIYFLVLKSKFISARL